MATPRSPKPGRRDVPDADAASASAGDADEPMATERGAAMTPANDMGPGEAVPIREPARRSNLWKWGLAAVASLAVHGAVAYAFRPGPPPEELAMVEGAQGVTLAVEGDPFDAVAAGEENATAEPLEAVQPDTEVPVETAETQTPETVEPVEEAPPEEVVAALPDQPVPVVPDEPDVVAPVAPDSAETIVSAAPPEAVEAEPEVVEAVPENLPTPTVRPRPPEREPPPRRVAERPREEPRRERPQPRREEPRVQRGSQGEQQANLRAGARSGAAGSSTSQGARGRQGSGTASLSNYRGQLVARIERAKRNSVRVSGERIARVSFSISASGSLTGVSLAGSSGDARLDSEAVATVRRAAPYPPVPAGVSTPFSAVVPIRFR